MNSNYNYLLRAARHSRGDDAHWCRYLRKIIKADSIDLDDNDIDLLLKSGDLTDEQKSTLSQAVIVGSDVHKQIVSLNQPYVKKGKIDAMIQALKESRDNEASI